MGEGRDLTTLQGRGSTEVLKNEQILLYRKVRENYRQRNCVQKAGGYKMLACSQEGKNMGVHTLAEH